MNFELKSLPLSGVVLEKCDALLVLVTDQFKPASDALSNLIARAIKSGDLETKPGKLLQLYQPVAMACTRLILVGAGDGSPKQVRQAVQAALATATGSRIKKVVLALAIPTTPVAMRAAIRTIADSSYRYNTTKSIPEPRALARVIVALAETQGQSHLDAFNQACAEVKGIELAKEWGNRPANHATPRLLAVAAKELAKLPAVSCTVMGPAQVAKLGMGSFMAVAQGSREELRFIVLRYQGGEKFDAPVVLVGKGITFDTGGISIKPAAEMDEMKFDMCGAASVLGVFRALAELGPQLNVIGLIPACENMPDGLALKPGDVVTSMSGQTIEVLNTDAEGRLILCDALTYAERFKPRAVIDIATLTGACVIALGAVRSGMYATNDELATQLMASGEASLDPCWRMPLDDEYAEGLKSNFADVANVAGRAGGSITAAKFLQRFAGKFSWAHLDIAGTAWKSGASKGATGRPVALLLNYLLALAATRSKTKPVKRAKMVKVHSKTA